MLSRLAILCDGRMKVGGNVRKFEFESGEDREKIGKVSF